MSRFSWPLSHGLSDTASFAPIMADPFFVNMAAPDSLPLQAFRDNGHPNFTHLNILVLSAVLEVVCVSLPGYIIARQGMFDAEAQKFLANLNVMLFTPCLSMYYMSLIITRHADCVQVFTKIASQLTPDKLPELAIIPVIFFIQTLVSYLVSTGISKLFRFKKRPQYFVTAMAVFGNSNSLPISLVISLAKTIPSLRWDKIPGDNDEEVAARGILYLMIFQQLGQLLRWSWGYHYLLAKPEKFTIAEGGTAIDRLEYGDDHSSAERTPLLIADDADSPSDGSEASQVDHARWPGSGTLTPKNGQIYPSPSSATLDELHSRIHPQKKTQRVPVVHIEPPEGTENDDSDETSVEESADTRSSPMRVWRKAVDAISKFWCSIGHAISERSRKVFYALPPSVQTFFTATGSILARFLRGLWEFMNPPLWAMLAAIIIASVPKLQHYFFTKGTFINTSITRAVDQSGGVAVPLILVVLGANLARNTLPPEQRKSINDDDPKLERKLLIACLVSRMLLPTIIMTPILAMFAKYVPVSILDDPVFVVVAFLLTGAPSALQLAQICQLNNVYVPAMTKLLFQSYVVWYVLNTLLSESTANIP
jgi:predicted permease